MGRIDINDLEHYVKDNNNQETVDVENLLKLLEEYGG